MPHNALLSGNDGLDRTGSLDDHAGLVPAARFGAVLHRARAAAGRSLAELARNSEGRWLPDALVAAERGGLRVSDDEVADLAGLYRLDPYPWISPSSAKFVLDRTAIGDRPGGGWSGWDHERTQHEVAICFVASAILMGIDLTSGVAGVAAVAEAMEVEAARVLRRSGEILEMYADDIAERIAAVGDRVMVPAAGMLIVEVPTGSLVLIRRFGTSGFAPTVPPAGRVSDLVDSAR